MRDLIAELRHPNPHVRKEAIVALVEAGDSSVIDILNRVAATDADAALRHLAEKGAVKLQREQWRRAQETAQPVYLPDELEPGEAELRAREARRIGQAQENLSLASKYQLAGESDRALTALSSALGADPTLAQRSEARQLAADLLGIWNPDEAMSSLLERIEDERQRLSRPSLDPDMVRNALIAFVAAILLLVLLALFYRLINKDLVSVIRTSTSSARVSVFLRSLSPALLARAFVPALLLLIAISIGNFAMYWLSGIWGGGAADLAAFFAALMVAQVMTIALGIMAIAFLPVTTIVQISGPNGSPVQAVAIASWLLAAGFFWNALMQGYIVSKLQEMPMLRSTLVVIIGLVVFTAMSSFLLNVVLRGVSVG